MAWAVVALAVGATPSEARAYSLGVAGSLAKFRADAPPPPLPASAALSAARNEFESFQIVLSGPATHVTASASSLSGPGSATISPDDVRLYREDVLDITCTSFTGSCGLSSDTPDDVPGFWPDALVPAVDELYGEARNAFPFSVSGSETRAIWVDVFVPPGTPSGDYSGGVLVTFDEAGTITVPVSLHVWNFDLPSTSHLRSYFALSYGAIPAGHGVDPTSDWSEIRHAYGQLALDHRISLSGFDDGDVSAAHVSSRYGDLLDGAAPTRLPNASLTSLEIEGNASDWWSVFAASPPGYGPLLVSYSPFGSDACDQPASSTQWANCHVDGTAAHAVSPQLRTLVTTSISDATSATATNAGFTLADVNLMTPEINALPVLSSPLAYLGFLGLNPIDELWVYESCDTHGCAGGSVDPWPTHVIDSDPVRNRALEWLAFEYGVTGELYYETGYAFGQGNPGPWVTQWAFTGNGDGTLFYPGVPDTSVRSAQSGTPSLGGTHDIPVASMRLKLIREGMEDYEYLVLDQALGGDALGLASALFPSSAPTPYPGAYPTNDALMSARARIAADIEARNGTTPAPGFAVTATPSSVSSSTGGSFRRRRARSTVTITPSNGFTGTVSLSAQNLPAHASASFSPTSVTISGAGAQSSTLTLLDATDPAGTYVVTVVGTSPGVSPAPSATITWTLSTPADPPRSAWRETWRQDATRYGR
jgi:hypothetical protein